tara:strand:- start:7258 stop:8055 length:798 start_codon:yes stop_codon:yes gene_type:complete
MKLNAACLQLTSNDQPLENLEQVLRFSEQAVQSGANFILTPENTFLFTMDKKTLNEKSEHFENGDCINHIRKFVKSKKIWFLIGSTPVQEGKNIFNRSILLNPNGEVVSTYDKIHMFDVDLPNGETYRESAKFKPGNKIVVTKIPWGNLGLSICYDLRFPNHYRELVKKRADLITAPSAFTKHTGERHWHVLIRSRAIENFSYVFAPAQTGLHYNKRETYGHTMIVSPDGYILSEIKNKTGFIISEIDTDVGKKLRSEIPSIKFD